ncbi:hypothetical protein F8S13_27190 [Chloroflexia bacterium SDU3-3]|nr:hypothetical protein F8S13_27190 [Chloroflexia bacterium SDU3-3]
MTAPSRTARRRAALARAAAALLAALALSGCVLYSGEVSSSDTLAGGGNVSTSFVSAEGSDERQLATGGTGDVDVITIVSAAEGTLTVDLLDPTGAVVFSVSNRSREPVTRSDTVPTDAEGILRYRITATGARNGSFQLLYQRAAP